MVALSLVLIAVNALLVRFGERAKTWLFFSLLRSQLTVGILFWIPWSVVLRRYGISSDSSLGLTLSSGVVIGAASMLIERRKSSRDDV